LEARAYLNHAAIAPASEPTVHAVREALDDYARLGVLAFPRWEQKRQALRAQFATLIGARAEEVALGWNTSRGVSDVALALPWKAGDRVLLFEGEFPANVTPWQRAAERFGLEVVFHPARDFEHGPGLERLEAELRRGVRLVAVSAVQFQTGLRMPLAQMAGLCHSHGAELFVDAIQACGAVPLNVAELDLDYLVTGGHKWLLGVEGGGFIYVKDQCAAKLEPLTAGWLSHCEPVDFLFKGGGHLRYDRELRTGVDVFETGTASLLALAALGASVPLLLALGPGAIFEHVDRYLGLLETKLLERGFHSVRSADPAFRSCILSVLPPQGIGLLELSHALKQRGVMVGTPDGYLRFSPHYSNALSEVDAVVEAVDSALHGSKGA
jgi:selenocysteine lyase/cysteine desulfurase